MQYVVVATYYWLKVELDWSLEHPEYEMIELIKAQKNSQSVLVKVEAKIKQVLISFQV